MLQVRVQHKDNLRLSLCCIFTFTITFKILQLKCLISKQLQVKVQHKDNLRLFEAQHCDLSRTFGIQHYAGRVVYDTTDFLGEDEDDDDN